MSSSLQRFLFSHGASALATGIHLVALAWLAVAVLGLSAAQWAWVQAAGLLPNLVLLLYGGAVADRYNSARVLAAAQTLLALSYLLLALALAFEVLHFVGIILYAVMVGVGNAFLQPAREKLVAVLQTETLQKRVSLFSITQFSLQALGMLCVASSEVIDMHYVFFLQAGLAFVAALGFQSIVSGRSDAAQPSLGATRLFDILRMVKSDARLRQLLALVLFNGYMHMGVFLVLVPVVATTDYGLSASRYAVLQVVFVLGMIAAHIALFRQRHVEFPGQGALFSLLYTALVGFGLSQGPTLFGFYAMIFFWGLVAGNSAGRCRLVLQSLVNAELKGRAMALYQLCLFGAAPVGALATGYFMTWLPVPTMLRVMAVSSACLFIVFMLSRALWSVKQSSVDED